MKTIDFASFSDVKQTDAIFFVKPEHCKVFRVYHVPEVFKETGKYDDIIETLDTTCSKKLKNVWFYNPEDIDMIHFCSRHFNDQMDVENFLMIRQAEHGYDDNCKPIPEILN